MCMYTHTYMCICVNIHIELMTMFCLVSEIPFSSLELILIKNTWSFYLYLNLFYLFSNPSQLWFTCSKFKQRSGFWGSRWGNGRCLEAGTDEDLDKSTPWTHPGIFHSSSEPFWEQQPVKFRLTALGYLLSFTVWNSKLLQLKICRISFLGASWSLLRGLDKQILKSAAFLRSAVAAVLPHLGKSSHFQKCQTMDLRHLRLGSSWEKYCSVLTSLISYWSEAN